MVGMKLISFIAHTKEEVDKQVSSFVSLKDITILNIRRDVDYSQEIGGKKTYRTMVYYVKKG